MVFSLISKTFQQPLTNWSNDMQQKQLVYFFMLRSEVAWTEVRCHEDIQTFYCYVPVPGRTLVTSGNVMLGTFHTKILILQTFMEFCNCFFILQFSYVMAQVHNCQTKNGASWTSWTGPKLLRIGANVDLTR